MPRLDIFLAEKLSLPRNKIKKAVERGDILVNGKKVKPSYVFKEGDKLDMDIKEESREIKANPAVKLNIVFENDDIMVIDKPSGLIVHPANNEYENTLVNGLLAYYPAIKDAGEDSARPGIVHRLDKETSGLILVCKNRPAFDYFKNLFQQRKITKKYLALVYGKLKDEEGVIDKPIGRSGRRPLKQAILANGKEAITFYKVREELVSPSGDAYTLLEAEPKTGRMHQIRLHLHSIGHPVVGDKKYFFRRQTEPEGVKRMFLHAAHLKFPLPDGNVIELKSELPEELQEILNYLSTKTQIE